ncbi:MAG: 3-hydroxyacyl-ACP dehydratase [Mucilaginibacter sp.]|jgi:predicted hotdog family 3-hydroxylacyl-ACP dehydratase|nr:3-hydroxyacyl-ACP dehydratase [Mucilaginibacter sp.]
MQLPVNDITSLIPQKQPFVMVNKLLLVDETSTRSSFVIEPGNVFVKNGFFQEAGLMENIAQTAALRAGYLALTDNKPVENGYIGSVKDFEVLQMPQINDELLTEISITGRIFNVTVLTGRIWLNESLIASCEMKVFEGN